MREALFRRMEILGVNARGGENWRNCKGSVLSLAIRRPDVLFPTCEKSASIQTLTGGCPGRDLGHLTSEAGGGDGGDDPG